MIDDPTYCQWILRTAQETMCLMLFDQRAWLSFSRPTPCDMKMFDWKQQLAHAGVSAALCNLGPVFVI